MAHQYASLNLGAVADARDILPEKDIALSKHPAETVRVFVSPYGREFVYGYQVGWADGRSSFRNPNPAIGRFRSVRDAALHCIGFMKHYREHFHPDTMANIMAAERQFLKTTLPLD